MTVATPPPAAAIPSCRSERSIHSRVSFLHAVRPRGAQVVEVDVVEILVVEAGEHHALDAALRIALHLQALAQISFICTASAS